MVMNNFDLPSDNTAATLVIDALENAVQVTVELTLDSNQEVIGVTIISIDGIPYDGSRRLTESQLRALQVDSVTIEYEIEVDETTTVVQVIDDGTVLSETTNGVDTTGTITTASQQETAIATTLIADINAQLTSAIANTSGDTPFLTTLATATAAVVDAYETANPNVDVSSVTAIVESNLDTGNLSVASVTVETNVSVVLDTCII